MRQIVDNYHIFEISISENPQILYNKAIFSVHGNFIREKTPDNFASVNVIDDRFGIGFGGCREQEHLIKLANLLQEFFAKWPDIKRDLGETNFNNN